VGAPGTFDFESEIVSLRAEFPTVVIRVEPGGSEASGFVPTIDLASWNDPTIDFAPFDARMAELSGRGPVTMVVCGGHADCARASVEMLTRWQWGIGRRNAASRSARFDSLLGRIRALHDLTKPLVAADYRHALDTWQWTLRLSPDASAVVQMAALLHDVERLESEADRRVEHLAPSYRDFKAAHARRGAELARDVLNECGFEQAIRDAVARLIVSHESGGTSGEAALLSDADSLSFFSQNSAGYVDYFGVEQARHKVAFSLGRMRESSRARLKSMRVRGDVGVILAEALSRSTQCSIADREGI
jgi:hypothetical protein